MGALTRAWLPAVLVVAWWGVTRTNWLNPLFFPTPLQVFQAGLELARTGELLRHLGATLARLASAYLIGSFCGTIAGLTLGSLPFWRRSAQGLLAGLYATPKLALLPAILLIFGLNNASRLVPAAISCFVLMAAYSMDAARAVKPGFVDLARSYGAGRHSLFTRVYLPACLPSIFTGLRLGLGNALVIIIATEMLGANTGLGGFIWVTAQTLAMDRMYLGVLLCTMVGLGTNYAFEAIEKRVVPWTRVG